MDRVTLHWICAAVAALTGGLALAAVGSHGVHPTNAELKADRLDVAAAVAPTHSDIRFSTARSAIGPGLRLASLETGFAFDAVEQDETPPAAPAAATVSFDQRFHFGERLALFAERFAVTGIPAAGGDDVVMMERPPGLPLRRQDASRAPVRQPPLRLASLSPPPVISSRTRPRDDDSDLTARPQFDGRTAVYDIAARAVYLPSGVKLEAHSGLGDHLDDPRSIGLKGRGPTPPNVYNLALREAPFHGVRAIRLIPVDEGKMYGRDGMLAHTYMLGPNGDSNGCVSFNDYPAFLNAYLKGEFDRLVVVEHLDSAPGQKSATGWLADAIGGLFKPAERTAGRGHADDHAAALSYQ